MKITVTDIKSLILAVTIFFAGLIAPQAAVAQTATSKPTIQQRAEEIQEKFQDTLIAATKKDDQDLSDLMPLMGFLMVINIFSCLYKSGPDKLLVEMAKMSVWAFVAACVMGGSFYRKTNLGELFTVNKVICGKQFSHTGGGSLDRDILNYFKYATDELACGLYKQDVTSRYNQAVMDMFMITQTADHIPEKCFSALQENVDGSGQRSVLQCVREERNKEVAKKAETCTWAMQASGACVLQKMFDVITEIFTGRAIVYTVLLILQIFVQIIQFMVFFSMIVGIVGSLLMFKLISPFFVLESTRSKVLAATKVPLAIALYGFTHKTLLFFLTTLINAVSEASLISFEQFRGEGSFGGTMYVYLIVCVACIAVLTMQIVAIMKVPKIAMSLVNLSLQELVNVGNDMMKASFGMGMALTGAGVGAAALGASGLLSAAKGAAGSLGGMMPRSMGRMMPSFLGGGSNTSPSSIGASGRARYADTSRLAGVPRERPGSPMMPPGSGSPNGAGSSGYQPSSAPAPSPSASSNPGSPNPLPLKSDDQAASPAAAASVPPAVNGENVTVSQSEKPGSRNAAAEAAAQAASTKTKSLATGTTEASPAGAGASGSQFYGRSAAADAVGAEDSQANGAASPNENTLGGVNGSPQGGVPANPRTRKPSGKSVENLRSSAIARATTFSEFEAAKERFNNEDSPSTKKKNSRTDRIAGTFGSKQGRKELAKGILSGGGAFVKGIVTSAMAGPGSELDVTGAMSASTVGVKKAFDNGESRYAEFRESMASSERTRAGQAEVGLDAANETEAKKYDIINDDEYDDLMKNLELIISGVASEETKAQTLHRISAGSKTLSQEKDAELRERHREAMDQNQDYKAEAIALTNGSDHFIKVVELMAKKSELTNDDVAQLMDVLSLPLDAAAIKVYSGYKARLELLMKAKIIGDVKKK